jgi:PAS domain S-box-containing protein
MTYEQKTKEQLIEELRDSQNMLQLVINSIPQTVFWKDKDLVYLGCNENFAKAAGLTNIDDIIGKTDFDLPWPKKEAEAYRADDREVIETNQPKYHIVEPVQQADDSQLWVDTTKVPLYDDKGNIIGIMGVFEDITDQKQAEIQRDRAFSEARMFSALVENSIDAIVMTDLERKIIYANHACHDLFGCDYDSQEMIGLTPYDFWFEEDISFLNDEIGPKSRAGGWSGETRQKRKDGTQFFAHLTVFPLSDEKGNTIRTAVVMRDITSQRETEVERERLQQEIIEVQQRAIQELSVPIIPVMDRIIVLPLVGSIDSMRASDIMRTLLAGISQHQAKVVILDITGVAIVDTGVAAYLDKIVQAARLKGARTIITGISDAVAETIVDLGIDWSRVETLRDLQTGLVVALDSLGVTLRK